MSVASAEGRPATLIQVLTWLLPPFCAVCGILTQYVIFMRFVDRSGTSYGLFKLPAGSYYRYWSQHLPFTVTTAALALLAFGLIYLSRRRGASVLEVFLLLVYIIIIWSLVAASTGVVSLVGVGEAFL